MSFRASATTMGNSKGFRLDAALYREHPEFASGEFEVDVIAPGRLLVRAEPGPVDAGAADPVFDAFLHFLSQELKAHPEQVTSFTVADLRRVGELVAGVEVDRDADFPEDFDLP